MSKSLIVRTMRFLVVAAAAIGISFLPAGPAHATYGPQSSAVSIQLYDSTQVPVGSLNGTVEFDDGNTKFRYSLTVCRQSSYTTPSVVVYVNGAQHTVWNGWPATLIAACGWGQGTVYAAEVPYGSTVRNVTVELNGSGFSPQGVFEPRSKSRLKDNPYN